MNIRKTILFLTAVTICISLFSLKVFAAEKKKSISLNTSNLELDAGKSYTLKANVKGLSKYTLQWTSSDSKTVTVKKGGKITALKPGNAKITVKIKGTNLKATCLVNVKSSDSFESSYDAAKNMKAGICIGNSLDSYGDWIKGDVSAYETAWGNPVITKELVSSIKKAGFNAVRIPVTYVGHTDENGKIDSKWLNRVKEVVDYVYDENMYCIINVHHDTGSGDEAWLRADSSSYKNGMQKRYVYLWEQIADYFKDYDEHLLFEGFNEILDKNSNWGGSNNGSYEIVNKLNADFVNTVRKSGGNNSYRNIIVNTYGASSAQSQINGFTVPTDTATNHLIAEVHIYDPSDFCSGDSTKWTKESEKVVDDIFMRLNQKIIKGQNTPMIIGEFAAQEKSDTSFNESERAKYAEYFVSKASNYGITCFWWDDGGKMKLFDRNTYENLYPEITEALTN